MTVKSMPSRWESLNINPTERQLVFIVSCWGNVERSNTERKRSDTEMRRTAFQDRLATSYFTIIISIITHTTRRHPSWWPWLHSTANNGRIFCIPRFLSRSVPEFRPPENHRHQISRAQFTASLDPSRVSAILPTRRNQDDDSRPWKRKMVWGSKHFIVQFNFFWQPPFLPRLLSLGLGPTTESFWFCNMRFYCDFAHLINPSGLCVEWVYRFHGTILSMAPHRTHWGGLGRVSFVYCCQLSLKVTINHFEIALGEEDHPLTRGVSESRDLTVDSLMDRKQSKLWSTTPCWIPRLALIASSVISLFF